MGTAASTLPEEKVSIPTPTETAPFDLPPEILEEILLNLPVKSLLRFSAVSKAWHSMIFGEGFIEKQKSRARKMIVIATLSLDPDPKGGVSTRPLSSISSEQIIDDHGGEPFFAPFHSTFVVLASCGNFWCVEFGRSLFLWNPSMGESTGALRKLPKPLIDAPCFATEFCFGVGHDSAGGDYKVVKWKINLEHPEHDEEDEMYSLRSDSWKKIPPFPGKRDERKSGVFADGALHWLAHQRDSNERVIVSFDLATEKYAEVPAIQHGDDAELGVFRGKLCLFLSYQSRYVMSVMQGEGESTWSEVFECRYGCIAPPLFCWSHTEMGVSGMRGSAFPHRNVFMYIDEETGEKTVFRCKSNDDFYLGRRLFFDAKATTTFIVFSTRKPLFLRPRIRIKLISSP